MESPDGFEEERRLFYVALTRAKVAATLSYAETRFKWGNMEFSRPSCFLREIDSRYLDRPQEEHPLPRRGEAAHESGRSALDELRRRFDYRFKQQAAAPRQQEPARPVVTPPPPSTVGMRRLGSRPAETPRQAGPPCTDYAVGERVEHPKFGAGTILRIETLASDHKLVVEFGEFGQKTLLAKFARLTKL